MYAKTITSRTILHAWEKTNLVLYKSSVILCQIHAKNAKCREKTLSSASKSLLDRISQDFQEIVNYNKHINTCIDKINMSSNLRLTLKRYTKESIVIVYSCEIAK